MTKIVVVDGKPFELYRVTGSGWSSCPRTVLDIRKRLEEKFKVNKLSPEQRASLDILTDYPGDYFTNFGGRAQGIQHKR